MARKQTKTFFGEVIPVPTKKDLIFDAIAFTGTLIAALVQGWLAQDVIWGAWLASLTIGLSFFFIMTGKMIFDVAKGELEKSESQPGCLMFAIAVPVTFFAWIAGPGIGRIICSFVVILTITGGIINSVSQRGWLGSAGTRPMIRALAYMPEAMFILCFFFVHFGMFHMGHAAFLGFIVPLQLDFAAPMDSIADFFQTIKNFFAALILAYWPYVLSVGVMNFGRYRNALLKTDKKDFMIIPYKNVVRIHILIFVLFPLAMLDLGRMVMIMALFFFFFPVESLATWYKSKK